VQTIICLKRKLNVMIHIEIKPRVYVWVDCYYQLNILLIDMIEDLCMIKHTFKSVHFFFKRHLCTFKSGLIVDWRIVTIDYYHGAC
jgi:hypothetical protein